MNKQTGNMYPFVTHTWNPIRGTCPHQCSYCYVPKIMRGKWGELRLDEKSLNENLGAGNFIFVGSSTDMWAEDIYCSWQLKVLNTCFDYIDNTYLFQTKDPRGFEPYMFLSNMILGVTLETNRLTMVNNVYICRAPHPMQRLWDFQGIKHARKMVSIEPVMDFDLLDFAQMIETIKPEFVSIGADSGHNNLPEPPPEKVKDLIKTLESFTKVIQKKNLKRLMG